MHGCTHISECIINNQSSIACLFKQLECALEKIQFHIFFDLHYPIIHKTISNSRSDSNVIKTAVTAQQERDAVMKTRLALDALPKTFLRTDFDMGNPQIFTSVLSVNANTDLQR